MVEKSRRGVDSRGEKALGLFLEQYFYPILVDRGVIDSYERIYDKHLQIKGSDMFLSLEGRSYKLDEKAQLYYINRPRDTFALEINFLSPETNEVVPGWFVSKVNETDMYSFIWIHKSKEEKVERLVSHDFDELTLYFVEKKTIRKYLETLSYSTEKLIDIAIEMRKIKAEIKNITDKVYFVLSSADKYIETPVNLVLAKEIFEEIALGKYRITKEEITCIE